MGGCVIMEVVLQDRLFLFVFGGQEAMYKDREQAYKNVYECRVARQIWQDYWEKGLRFKAIVLLATFDHYDLQKLLIERMDGDDDGELQVLSPIDEEVQSRTGDDINKGLSLPRESSEDVAYRVI